MKRAHLIAGCARACVRVRAQVHAYKELRSEDAMPGSASAYRITVRQLEALVRLSEATARAYCSPSITPAHVEASKRLLRSSILKIEQQDVDLEDDDPVSGVRVLGGAGPCVR